MTKYTKESPYRHLSVSIWRNTQGLVRYSHPGLDATVIAQAMHAFIEEEATDTFVDNNPEQDSQPAPFTPLPVPKAGQWIRAELRDGSVVEGKVERIVHLPKSDEPRVSVKLSGQPEGDIAIPISPDTMHGWYITAWNPIDPPQAWRDAKPGDVLDVRIDGGDWVRALVCGSSYGVWICLAVRGDIFDPWTDTDDRDCITDSRFVLKAGGTR